MIQRIQSIYFLLASLLSLPFVRFTVFEYGQIGLFTEPFEWVEIIPSIGIAILSFGAIFLFKNRSAQGVVCKGLIVSNLLLLGLVVIEWLSSTSIYTYIAILFPIFSTLFLLLANRGIQSDNKLIKDMDRLR